MRKLIIGLTALLAVTGICLSTYLLATEYWIFASVAWLICMTWLAMFFKANWPTLMKWIKNEKEIEQC